MEIDKVLSKIARENGLVPLSKNLKYMVLPREDILVIEFLLGYLQSCQVPSIDIDKQSLAYSVSIFESFLSSDSFIKYNNDFQGCAVSPSEIKSLTRVVKRLSSRVSNENAWTVLNSIASELPKMTSQFEVLISTPLECESNDFDEVLLHEGIHVLLEENGVFFEDWKWNEGLVTYLTLKALGKTYYNGQRSMKITSPSPMLSVYYEYTTKWRKIFENQDSPNARRRIMLAEIKARKVNQVRA